MLKDPRMLYEFHTWQNGKRSGSVHATYMMYGSRKTGHTNGHSQQDGDVDMTSSAPEADSTVDDGPVITLSIVAEESLKGWTELILPMNCGFHLTSLQMYFHSTKT